jgi:LacI family transcriptional regulator
LSGIRPNHFNGKDFSSVTIKEVARQAGVSIATVSRVLNGSPFVKKKNKEKVMQAIDELGYKPNVFAQHLAGGKLNAVGLIIPGYEGVFYSFYAQEIIRNVGSALEDLKKDLFLHIFWDKDNFNSSYVEGVIFADVIRNEHQVARLVKEKVPCVVINKKVKELPVSFVAIDNEKGAIEAMDFLVELGHRKIAHIAGDLNTQCAVERLEGFKKVVNRSKLSIPDYFIQEGYFSRVQARRSVEFLLSQREKPTAIFCASDDMAYEVLLMLLERKIRVPEEISVVGFDDNPQYTYGPLTLTTVNQPLHELIGSALNILEGLISGELTGPEQKILSTKLVVGDSTTYARQF